MLEALVDRARGRGRTSFGVDAWDVEAPPAFAARHGFEPKSAAVNRRQVLAEVDLAELASAATTRRWRAPRTTSWSAGRGPRPTTELDAVAEMTAAINDAPTDDLDIEDEVFPPERIRAYEQAQAGPRPPALPGPRPAPRDRRAGGPQGRGRRRRAAASSASSTTPRSSRATAATGSGCCSRPNEPVAARGGAAARLDRHLERRVQRPHDRRQRGCSATGSWAGRSSTSGQRPRPAAGPRPRHQPATPRSSPCGRTRWPSARTSGPVTGRPRQVMHVGLFSRAIPSSGGHRCDRRRRGRSLERRRPHPGRRRR